MSTAMPLSLLGLLWTAVALAQPPKPEGESFFFTPPGSTREGQVKTATGDDIGTLHLDIRDAATGKPTFCRVAVLGPDGDYYQPKTNYLSPYALTGEWPKDNAWGNRRDKAPYRFAEFAFGRHCKSSMTFTPLQERGSAVQSGEWEPIPFRLEVTSRGRLPLRPAVCGRGRVREGPEGTRGLRPRRGFLF